MSSMYVFTPKSAHSAKSNLSCFTETVQKSKQAGALIYRQQTIYWILSQTKLSIILGHKPIVTYWTLMKRLALLKIQAKLKLAINTIKLVFFLLIIKITISSLVISLKKSCFPLIRLPSCYRTVCYFIVCYWTVCYRTV